MKEKEGRRYKKCKKWEKYGKGKGGRGGGRSGGEGTERPMLLLSLLFLVCLLFGGGVKCERGSSPLSLPARPGHLSNGLVPVLPVDPHKDAPVIT
jgi:hypothetical protein